MRTMNPRRFEAVIAGLVLFLGGCQPAAGGKPAAPPATETLVSTAQANDDTTLSSTQSATESSESDAKIVLEAKSLPEILQRIGAEKGKWTIVDVWSTSCVPCMKEFPNLVALAKKYPDKVRCVSVNVDYLGLKSKTVEDYRADVEKFLKAQKAEFANFLCATPDSDVFTELEIESIPAVLVFSPEGEKRKSFTDANSGDDGVTYQGDLIPWLEEQLKPK